MVSGRQEDGITLVCANLDLLLELDMGLIPPASHDCCVVYSDLGSGEVTQMITTVIIPCRRIWEWFFIILASVLVMLDSPLLPSL